MARADGTYFLIVDYRSSDRIGTHHIPIQYGNGEAHLLMCDYDNDCWAPVGSPIMNFGEMTEKQIFEVVRKTHKFYSSLNEGDNYRLKYLKLGYGQCFNSIYRPVFTYDLTEDFQTTSQSETSFIECYKDLPINNFQEYSNQLRQLEIILDDMAEVFKVVVPHHNQFSVYGHAIRNIIILACTELDARMQSILANNGVAPNGNYFVMKDYFKLKEALKLDEYNICASAGSACSTGESNPSHVLSAIGLLPEKAFSTLRFSLGKENTRDEIDYVVKVLEKL